MTIEEVEEMTGNSDNLSYPGHTVTRMEVLPTIRDPNPFKRLSLFQLIYSLCGLFLGSICILGGIVLFLNGVVGSASWTAKVLGAESEIFDAAPGAILFIVGFFIVFTTRFTAKVKPFFSGSNPQVSDLLGLFIPDAEQAVTAHSELEKINQVVQEAVADGARHTFSRVPLAPRRETQRAGISLRKYFGGYFERMLPFLKNANDSNIQEICGLIDDFMNKTWLNHLLDSDIDTYVIRDYLLELTDMIDTKGGKCTRLTTKRLRHLVLQWDRIKRNVHDPYIDVEALDEVVSLMPKLT